MKDTVMEALSHQSEIYRRVQRGRAGAMAGEWPQRDEGRSRVGDPSGRLSVRVLFCSVGFQSSVIRPNSPCSSSAIPAVK